MNKHLSILLFLLFSTCFSGLSGAVLRDRSGQPVRRGGKYDPRPVNIVAVPARSGEFRGVWISTVLNLDFPQTDSAEEFKRCYTGMLNKITAAGFNAVIFQVRPNCDAFYPSRHAPSSRWLTGQEGRSFPGFDPLAFMIKEAHARRLEFHAWLNPYRVMNDVKISKTAYLKTLHPNHFAGKNPHLVLSHHSGNGAALFLDPGRPEVIRHILNVVYELASRYPVDAIHFDDYFYPYEEIGNLDDHTFSRYNPNRLSKGDWRRRNTEILIGNVKRVIDQVNARSGRQIRFGVSPFGIWGNAKDIKGGSATGGKQTFFNLYADTRKWIKKE